MAAFFYEELLAKDSAHWKTLPQFRLSPPKSVCPFKSPGRLRLFFYRSHANVIFLRDHMQPRAVSFARSVLLI